MHLTVLTKTATSIEAAYVCPCGCHPSVTYSRGDPAAHEGCCCGNQFAVGVDASSEVELPADFRKEVQTFGAPWGDELEAAWAIGPSTHAASSGDSNEAM